MRDPPRLEPERSGEANRPAPTEPGPPGARMDAADRRFMLLFLPIVLGFGGRMALVAFNGPLARLFTDNGYLIGALLAVGPLVSAVLNPGIGRLSDRTWTRFGRRLPYVMAGLPLSIAILFMIPHAPSYEALFLLFVVRAVVMAVAGVPLMAMIPDMTPAAWRGRIMSFFMVVGGIGAIAIQVSGKFFWESHFEWVYYLAGALSLIILPPLFFLREREPEPWELALARQRKGLSARALLAPFSQRDPVTFFLASALFRYFATGIVITYLTLFAQTDLGVSIGDAALAIAVTGGARLLLAIPAGRLADRLDRKRLLLMSTLLAASVHLLTGVAVWNLAGLYAVLLVGAVAGTLEMVVGGPLLMDLMPSDRRGEITGVNMVLQNLFRGVGALLGGAIFAWVGGYRLCFAVAAACMLVSSALLLLVRSEAEALE